jgi:hypothetical protein
MIETRTVTAWPNPNDYVEALQNPALAFDDPALRHGVVTLDKLGLPRPISGNFAIVFEVANRERRWAVRCFARETPGQEARYAAIARHLTRLKLPFMVGFEYLPKGVRVRGQWYPVVKMEWVRGVRLDTFIERNLNQPNALLKLALEWDAVIQALNRAQIAHGDLQHGNIAITDGDIRLIDYDGMIVPELIGKPSGEIGHRHYQHPSRTSEQGIDASNFQQVDTFSAWMIWASLIAVSIDPSLWARSGAGDDRLLFAERDYKNPEKSTFVNLLFNHRDARLREVARRLLLVMQSGSYLNCPPLDTQGILSPRPAPGNAWLRDHVGSTIVTNGSSSASAPASADWIEDHARTGTRPSALPIESPVPPQARDSGAGYDFEPAFVRSLSQQLKRDFAAMNFLERLAYLFNPQLFFNASVRIHFNDFRIVQDKQAADAHYRTVRREWEAAKAALDDVLSWAESEKASFDAQIVALWNELKQYETALTNLDLERQNAEKDFETQARDAYYANALDGHPIKPLRGLGFGASRVKVLREAGFTTYADLTPANKSRAIFALTSVSKPSPQNDWAVLEQQRERIIAQIPRFYLPPDHPDIIALRKDYAASRANLEARYQTAQAQFDAKQRDGDQADPTTLMGQIQAAVDEAQARLAQIEAQLNQADLLVRRYAAITPENLLRKLQETN